MTTAAIDLKMNQAVASGVFPGAHLTVFRGDEIRLDSVYGAAAIIPVLLPLTKDHLFDLASLTKPLCTATLAMIAFQDGLLDLDESAKKYFSCLHEAITIRNLLNHTSGLPAWQPYFRDVPPEVAGTASSLILQKITEEPIESSPGMKVNYSDLGYILLGAILEKIFETPLDELFQKKIAEPLGLKQTTFNPLRLWADPALYAATENCPWRGRVLRGEVHDDNAFVMGGVAGHAGLFSTSDDLVTWLMELRRAKAGGGKIIHEKTYQTFCEAPAGRDRRQPFFTPGFDTPSEPSSSGRFFSTQSLGHLGYAGTSFWWDPIKDFGIVLLSNRVHPSSKNDGIKQFRPQIHDTIVQTLKLV